MPKTQIEFTEEDILELVKAEVRSRHKLKKDYEVEAMCIIDRDDETDKPFITVAAAFAEEVTTKAAGKK